MFDKQVLTIWAVTILGKLVVAAFSYRARANHPLFVAFCWSYLMISLVLWAINATGHDVWYFWAYYIGAIIKLVLLVGALWEVAAPMFFPLWVLPRSTRIAATVAIIVLGTIVVDLSYLYRSQHYQSKVAMARTIDEAFSSTLVILVMVAFCVANYLRIPWLKQSAFIAGGFAMFLFLDSAVFAYITRTAIPSNLVQGVHLGAHLLAESIWLAGLLTADDELVIITDAQVRQLCRIVLPSPIFRGICE